jgi:hypothetical protein
MGPRLLCFVSGAALTAFFVHLGLLATPFYGSGAFLWANVFACSLLAMALGHFAGDLIVSFAGREKDHRIAPILAVVGGLLAWLATYLSPTIHRWVLGHDPDLSLAASLGIALTSLLPGVLIAAIVPCELRARLDDCETPRAGARVTLRLMGLLCLGGIGGIILTAKPLLRADEVDVWLHAYATGGLLTLVGVAFVRIPFKVVAVLLLGGMITLCGLRPSEIQRRPYQVALATAWKDGQSAGLYYRWTTEGSIGDEELAALVEDEGDKPGVILCLEILDRLEAVSVSGESLRGTLDLLVPPDTKPFLMPFFEKVESVRSDGRGTFYIAIERTPGKRGAEFQIPGEEPGEYVRFWYRDDFTLHMTHKGNLWKLEFGPLTKESAGFLEFNDSYSTPIRVLNVAWWVDASVLGLEFEDRPTEVVIRAVAQGDIGGVKTIPVNSITKDKKPQKSK